jgi:peptidoglycan/LPS O-acetylase OafA/YrhL
MSTPHINSLIVILSALILGILGLSFVFSDLGPTETLILRISLTALFFFLSGAGIGYFHSKQWWLSSLTALWSLLFGAGLVVLAILKKGSQVFVLPDPPYISAGLMILFLPLGLSLLGGYIGNLAAQNRMSPRQPTSL